MDEHPPVSRTRQLEPSPDRGRAATRAEADLIHALSQLRFYLNTASMRIDAVAASRIPLTPDAVVKLGGIASDIATAAEAIVQILEAPRDTALEAMEAWRIAGRASWERRLDTRQATLRTPDFSRTSEPDPAVGAGR
jgi:hypothetical protein